MPIEKPEVVDVSKLERSRREGPKPVEE